MTASITPSNLGFQPDICGGGWRKVIGGNRLRFRCLRTPRELEAVEVAQRHAFDLSDRDLVAVSMLVVVPETGGEVVGAFLDQPSCDDPSSTIVGFWIAWGGVFAGRPRWVSDMLGVAAAHRGIGLGFELKRLQAALALTRGIKEIVWTFDSLRLPNARLNFEKLGAHAARYERDRYGPDFNGTGPSDRLHVTWQLTDPGVRARLLGQSPNASMTDCVRQSARATDRILIPLPTDYRQLDEDATSQWRERYRATLEIALRDEGFAIIGCETSEGDPPAPTYVLERRVPRPALHVADEQHGRTRDPGVAAKPSRFDWSYEDY